jgi:hypothetical protein
MTPNSNQTCAEHNKLIREQTELGVMFRTHADATRQSLERILALLQGQGGSVGLSDRVTKLETHFESFITQTDTHIEKLVTAIQGKDGDGGIAGRMGKLERVWALLIGVAIASGAAGAGFVKLFSLVGG